MTKLTDQIYWLRGSGANLTVSIGPECILLVDCDYAASTPKIKEALAQVSPAPVKYLIDTHWHDDHTGGNAGFAKDGTIIIAQAKVLERLRHPQFSPYFSVKTEAQPPEMWPKITFTTEMMLTFNGEDLQMAYLGPAHCDNDAIVYFPKSNVMCMGDIFINGMYPIIDVGTAGTIDGYFPILDRALAMIDNETQVVAGHGPVGTKKGMTFYRDMLVTIHGRVAKMRQEGRTVEEVVEAKPSKEFDPEWASDRVSGDAVTRMIYESMKV
jgi:glyoxylase-like metal-dependent hydrolase (beta-lactamase superfamily II)